MTSTLCRFTYASLFSRRNISSTDVIINKARDSRPVFLSDLTSIAMSLNDLSWHLINMMDPSKKIVHLKTQINTTLLQSYKEP